MYNLQMMESWLYDEEEPFLHVEALDTFELLDDIENELGIATCPVNWPIGSGKNFKGVYERESQCVITYADTEKGTKEGQTTRIGIDEEDMLISHIGEAFKTQLLDEIDLLDGASAEYDLDRIRAGELTPVFFVFALTNFGVEIFLQHFLTLYSIVFYNSSFSIIFPSLQILSKS